MECLEAGWKERAILLARPAVVPDFSGGRTVETPVMATAAAARASRWRHVPNALSATRIACAPVLLLLALAGEQVAYTWVLVPALLTDALDGWIARALGVQSRLGARLDSLGDSLVWTAGLAGLLAFQHAVLLEYRWLVGTAVAFWLLENLLAWLRYGRLSSYHTRLSKVAGVLLGICIAGAVRVRPATLAAVDRGAQQHLRQYRGTLAARPAAAMARRRARRVVVAPPRLIPGQSTHAARASQTPRSTCSCWRHERLFGALQ
jgi:phosphatidylglycerophosphate synthase